MQEYTRKKAKEAKNHTQALRELKYSYTQKNDFSLELNPGGGGGGGPPIRRLGGGGGGYSLIRT